MAMTTDADTYFTDGCGRCALGGTPECKVHRWKEPLFHMRRIMLDTPLQEESKWGAPCYTWQGKNMVLIGAFNDCCVISFLHGSLLNDSYGLLQKPGENSQAARVIRFTEAREVIAAEDAIRQYVFETIEHERAGIKPVFKDISEHVLPEELQARLDRLPEVKRAFESLTPGRQRGYIIFISSAKQAKTRESRIDKCIPLILQGKGIHD